MANIEIFELTQQYESGTVGLDKINLQIGHGEFVALVGPSGSGKTTLLRAIAGFVRPQTGTLRIGGAEVFGVKTWVAPEQRRLGMVFQDHAVWPHLTVAANVAYPLRRQKLPRAEIKAAVAEQLAAVGLQDYAQRYPHQLSGGQRQRVALARAVIAQPQALLLDEALSALDEPLRVKLRLELRRLTRQQELTAVHVTHDRTEAIALADKLVVLQQGKIAQIGRPHEILAAPASAFVAHFLADATLFSGTLVNGVFYADQPGVNLPRNSQNLTLVNYDSVQTLKARRVTAAVTPESVDLLSPSGKASVECARVTSVLHGVHMSEISLDWGGTEMRVSQPRHSRVSEGDWVAPRIRAAYVYI
ncbi:ABC transporter ATP-binding protein [Leucobacter sp. OH2974_COT-288]|nr:ABC transporter ATP-binding protein [Leucobacter sp. OH2974_COT-288]